MKKVFAFVVALTILVPMFGAVALAEEEFVITENTPIVNAYFTGENSAQEYDCMPDTTMAIDTKLVGEAASDSYVHFGASWQLGTEPRFSFGLVSKRVHEDVETVPAGEPETVKIVGVKAEMEKDGFEIKEDSEGNLQMYKLSDPENVFSGPKNWFSLSEDETFLEFGVLLSTSAIHTADDGTLYAKLKLTVTLENNVTEVFDGAIVLKTTKLVYSNTMAGEFKPGSIVDHNAEREFTKHNFSKYTFDATNGILTEYFDRQDINASGYQLYSISDKNGNALYAEGQQGTLSFDFKMPNVPYAEPKQAEESQDGSYGNDKPFLTNDENGVRAVIIVGVGEGIVAGSFPSGKALWVFSIYNTENGLKLYYDAGQNWENNCISLGVDCEEFFKLSLEWGTSTTGYLATVYVNNEQVGTLELPAEKALDLPIYRGNGAVLGFAADKTDNNAAEQSFCYRNIVLSVEGSKMNNKINSLLDNFGYVAPAPAPVPPAGGDDENDDGENNTTAPSTTDNTTTAPATQETPTTADTAEKEKGCKSVASTLAVLVLGMSAAAVVLKKKED